MANIQHLYRGEGNPNDNPALELTGDAVGNHLYQDIDDSQLVWMSVLYVEEGHAYHIGWERLVLGSDLRMLLVEYDQPVIEGQMGLSVDEALFIAMWDGNSDGLRWRSTGITLGDWYEPP